MSAVAAAEVLGTGSRSRATRHSRWVSMAVLMIGLMLLYAAWQVFQWPSGHREMVGDVFADPMDIAAAGAAWVASRRCVDQPRLRSAWRLMALAAALYLAGDVVWTIYEVAGTAPYPSAADVLYLLFYPVMLWALLRFPAARINAGDRVRLGLDLAVVAIGGSVVVVDVLLGPTVVQSGPDVLQTAISVAYPVGDMVLLVGLGTVILRRPPASSTSALRFIAAGLMFFIVGDLAYGYITLHSTYEGGGPVDSLWMLSLALFAVAGAAQTAPVSTAQLTPEFARRRASWAPYVAVAVGFGLLVFDQRNASLLPHASLVIAAVLLATLVSIRQFLAQKDLVQTQGQLSYQSLHDTLTGLPNRALVIDRAEQMLARARRSDVGIAVLYVDVDGFKDVNDSLGHAAGDELLRVVARRLSEVVREADTVGRLGGDEFVVLLENLVSESAAELVAERICEVLRQPSELLGSESRALSVTASVGIALGQRASATELLRDADFALYEAKRAGKNRVTVFESRMHTAARDRIELASDLKNALEVDQFFLLYQPTFDLQSETITGVEALIRWRHPSRGIIPPATFIPLAEETGLIVPIGRWVLRTACTQAAAWHNMGHPLGMSVNISARQLDHDDLISDVAEAIASTELDPTTLTLEITETTLMRDSDAATRRLRDLKDLGVRIAIDDFGTGYCSLAYLRQFPVDALKIDRTFISGIAASNESKALIHMLVQLGKALGLETLGEGIEEQAQLRQLQREECDYGQGFLFARPLEPDAIVRVLEVDPQRPAANG